MVYVFSGDDSRYIEYYNFLDKLKLKLNYYDGSNLQEFDNFKIDINTNNLFNEKKVIVLKNISKIGNIYDFINKINTTKDVVIDLEDTGIITKKIILKDNIKVHFSKDKISKINYISKELSLNHLECNELIEITGESFLNIRSEVLKIKSLNRILSFKSIKELLFNFKETNFITFVGIIIEGKIPNDNIDTFALLNLLSSLLKIFLRNKLLGIEINSYNKLLENISYYSKIKQHPYFIYKSILMSKRFNEYFLKSMIHLIIDIEYSLKNGKISNAEALSIIKHKFALN